MKTRKFSFEQSLESLGFRHDFPTFKLDTDNGYIFRIRPVGDKFIYYQRDLSDGSDWMDLINVPRDTKEFEKFWSEITDNYLLYSDCDD